MASPYDLEKQVALSAVLRACSLTSSVFNTLVKGEVVTKEDKSPVTSAHLFSLKIAAFFFPSSHTSNTSSDGNSCFLLLSLVGDYSAQAVINTILTHAFPADPIVGEEDAIGLRETAADEDTEGSSKILRDRIEGLANEALVKPLYGWEKPEWGVGAARPIGELLDAIDRGNSTGGRTGRK